MKTLPRTQFGNPILRSKAKAVPRAFIGSTPFKELVRQMFHTMHRADGVGLAAPQVGQPIQLAVIQPRGSKLRRIIINPRIIRHTAKKVQDWEGCLSFIDARGLVPRWDSVTVRYMDEKGETRTETHKGYAARIFQHEIDHLNGTLYVDRMPDMRTLMTRKEFLKRVAT